MSSDTIFDKIIRKEIPAKIAYEDDDVLAFYDISPVSPVHVLVLPKLKVQKFSDFVDVEAEEIGKLFKGAATVAQKLGLNKDGYRIVVNCGKHGQQTVDYLHVHILGGRQLDWPPG